MEESNALLPDELPSNTKKGCYSFMGILAILFIVAFVIAILAAKLNSNIGYYMIGFGLLELSFTTLLIMYWHINSAVEISVGRLSFLQCIGIFLISIGIFIFYGTPKNAIEQCLDNSNNLASSIDMGAPYYYCVTKPSCFGDSTKCLIWSSNNSGYECGCVNNSTGFCSTVCK